MTLIIFYFDLAHAENTHDEVISISWWSFGYHKTKQDLNSVIEFMKHDDYYPSFEEKLTHLIFSINKNHIFLDWNKRTSIALWAYFLELNWYDYCVKYFIREMENISVWLAEWKITKLLLQKIVKSIIYEPEFDEALKLEIIHAISNQ